MTQQKSEKQAVPVGVRAYQWWRDNCQQDFGDNESARRPYDPAIRAKLRRCNSNTDAAMIPAAVSLAVRLQALRKDVQPWDPDVDAVLGLARVLSFVTENNPKGPMRALAAISRRKSKITTTRDPTTARRGAIQAPAWREVR